MSKKKKRVEDASSAAEATVHNSAAGGLSIWLWRGAIALIVVILLGRALGYPFLFHGEGNRLLADAKIVTAEWASAFSETRPWQPLAWISHMVDFTLFGGKPDAHRFVSLMLHVGNCLLVFGLFRRWTGNVMLSGATALIFAIHPLRIEPVIWLVERRTLLAAFFALLAMRAYTEYLREGRPLPWRVLVFAATLLAALSHPVGAIVPLLLLLVDVWPLERTEPLGARVLEKAELGLIGVFTVAMSIRAAANPEAVWTNGTFDVATRLWHSACGLGVAALRVLVPFPLDTYTALEPPVWGIAVAGALLAIAFVLRSRQFWVGLAWFFLALIPTLGLIRPEISPWHDSGTYLAGIGLTAGLVWFLASWDRDKFVALALTLGVIWSGLAWLRVGEWAYGETLLRTSVERGGHPLANYQLAQLLVQTQRSAEAEKFARAAAAARPDHMETRMLLASTLSEVRRQPEAITVLQDVTRRWPEKPDGYYALGFLHLIAGRAAQAAPLLEQAVQRGLPPELEAQAQNGIGVYHLNEKRYKEAETHLERAWKLVPKYASAHANFGKALVAQGRCRQAIAYLNRARLYTKVGEQENQEVVDAWTEAFNCNAVEEKKAMDAQAEMKKK